MANRKYPYNYYLCLDCNVFIGHPEKGYHRCRKCFDLFNKGENNAMFGRKGKESNNWKFTLEDHFCLFCGKKLSRKKKNKVCKDCYYGKYTPKYLGGVRLYGKGWTVKRRLKIKKRDNYTCQNPYCKHKKYNISEDTKLDVHHIDDDRENCNGKNLITLCHSCHSKVKANKKHWMKFFIKIVKEKYL